MNKRNGRRLVCLALLLALLLSLAGCGGAAGQTPDETAAVAAAASAMPTATPAPGEETPTPAAGQTPDAAAEQGGQTQTGAERGADGGQSAGESAPTDSGGRTDGGAAPTCTLSISCATILNNLDRCDADKLELVPADGWLLAPTTVTFTEGESVYDLLQRVCRAQGIHMEASYTPAYNSAYVEGIGNLYEFDVGSASGWMYSVNGWFPNYGCSRYVLADGATVCWVYTCNLGSDVGGSNFG